MHVNLPFVSNIKKLVLVPLVATACCLCSTADAKTVYVASTQSDDSGDGLSWASAKKSIQAAIAISSAGDEIWVKAGTYTPTQEIIAGNSRSVSFQLTDGIGLYGGFAGSETSRSSRDWQANATTLSGDIGSTSIQTDNAYHVIYLNATVSSPITLSTVIDGFSIQGGYADGSGSHGYGAGIYNNYASPTIANCTIKNNQATSGGGGIYNSSSSPSVQGCTFSGNKAEGATSEVFGGAIFNNSSDLSVANSTFLSNSANSTREAGGKGIGGGIYNSESSLALVNSTFSANTVSGTNNDSAGAAIFSSLNHVGNLVSIDTCSFSQNSANNGGALFNEGSNDSNYATLQVVSSTFSGNSAKFGAAVFNYKSFSGTFTNCTFSGNQASDNGGALYNETLLNNGLSLMNCTISGNSATKSGGGIYNIAASPAITNTIVWSNQAATSGTTEFYNDGSSTPTVQYCVIQNGYAGGSNIISDDPGLSALGNNGGTTSTMNLSSSSSAINAGTTTGAPATDQRGISRPIGSQIDVGAVEYFSQSSSITFTSITAGSIGLKWTAGQGDTRIVFAKQTDSETETASPEQSALYAARNTFGSGAQIGSTGWFCIHNGSDNATAMHGLSPNTTYRIMVCDYIKVSGVPIYNLDTASGNPVNVTTPNVLTVTFAAGNNGSISGTTPQSVEEGGDCTEVTAVPDAHYRFVNWTLDGAEYSTSAAITVTNVTKDMTLTANFTILTYTLSASAGENGTITPSGNSYAAYGSSQSYTIKADTGHSVDDVIVDGSSVGARNSYTFSDIDSNHAISATFKADFSPQETVTLLLDANPTGSGTLSPDSPCQLNAGDSVSITAVAAENYEFSGWTVTSGSCSIADRFSTTTTVTVFSDCSVSASFSRTDSGTLTLTMATTPGDYGTVTPGSKTVNYGETVSISAEPTDSNSYTFIKWSMSGNGVLEDDRSATTTVTVYGNISLTAVFANVADVATVTIEAGKGGSVTPNSSKCQIGDTITIAATPYVGYFFSGWSAVSGDIVFVDDCDRSSQAIIQVNSSTATVKATFSDATPGTVGTAYQIDIYDTNKQQDKDWIRLIRGPLPYAVKDVKDQLDISGSQVSVHIDGSPFAIDKQLMKLNRNNTRYRYVSANRLVRLTLDFKRGVWFFRARKQSLPFLENSDGIDIMLSIGDLVTGGHYIMGERGNWRIKNLQPGTNTFNILRAVGVTTDYRENSDFVKIFKGVLPADVAINQNKSVILSIDNMRFAIPADSFNQAKINHGIFYFPSKELKKTYKDLKLILNTLGYTWRFLYLKGDYNRLIDFTDGLDIYLLNDTFETGRTYTTDEVLYTRRLRFNDEDDD